MIITDIYEENELLYWPDTLVGSDLNYGVDWGAEYLPNENDTFVSMTWDTLPAGLTSSYNSDASDISLIQLTAGAAGTYCISGIMESTEGGHTQKLPVQMHLKVTALC
jgi:hypothetical protein